AGDVGSSKYFKVSIPPSQGFVQFRLWGGAGDADLYVKKGSTPTTTSYDYRPFSFSNNEAKALYASVPSGDWYFMIKGAKAYSGATMRVTWGASLDGYSDNKDSMARVLVSEMSIGNEY